MRVATDIVELWLDSLLKENLIHFCVCSFVGFSFFFFFFQISNAVRVGIQVH